MKLFKWIGGLLLVAVMGQIVVGYINYYKQFNQLKAQVSALEHENSNLRDEWVQWQRQNRVVPSSTSTSVTMTEQQQQNQQFMHQIQQLKQNFEFVQFALQQQQWLVALQRLEQIEQQLDDFVISEHLKLSLRQSIEQDKQQIKLTYQQAQQQQQSLNNLVQHLEQTLNDELKLDYQKPQQGSWWQRLWVVEKTTQPTVNTAQHQLLLKEIQLDVMFLKTMNVLQKPVEFQQIMSSIERKVQQLPLPIFNLLEPDLQHLNQIQLLNIPHLTSLALLGEQKEQP